MYYKDHVEIDYSPLHSIMGDSKNIDGIPDGEDLATNKAIQYNPGGNATLNVAYQHGKAGYYAELNYGNGLISQFLHLPESSIVWKNGKINGEIAGLKDPENLDNVLRIGDTIKAGQAFGFVGNTGNSGGPHSDVRHVFVNNKNERGRRPNPQGAELFRYLSETIERDRPSGISVSD